jgi:hypothetical protein
MLTDATAADTAPSNVVALDAQLLDVGAAAAYVRATVGVPLSATDLEATFAPAVVQFTANGAGRGCSGAAI